MALNAHDDGILEAHPCQRVDRWIDDPSCHGIADPPCVVILVHPSMIA